jgi:hypothetical protein
VRREEGKWRGEREERKIRGDERKRGEERR